MAVYSYGATNQSFLSFVTWSTEFASNSNLSLNTVMDNLEPADTAPHEMSELKDNDILYGTVHVDGAAGSVEVTTGYDHDAVTDNFILKNVNFDSVAQVIITATAVYPRYLEGFYDAADGGGTLLVDYNEPTTSGTITLTSSTFTGATNIYAYFVDAHGEP